MHIVKCSGWSVEGGYLHRIHKQPGGNCTKSPDTTLLHRLHYQLAHFCPDTGLASLSWRESLVRRLGRAGGFVSFAPIPEGLSLCAHTNSSSKIRGWKQVQPTRWQQSSAVAGWSTKAEKLYTDYLLRIIANIPNGWWYSSLFWSGWWLFCSQTLLGDPYKL